MKYILPFTFIAFLLVCKLYAQVPPVKITIKGSIADSAKNQPLAFVTIGLKNAITNAPVKSTLTKENGTFELPGLAIKAYKLTIIYLGYATKTIDLSESALKGKQVLDLKSIMISEAKGQLKEVSITAAKPLIKQEVDRIAYDVQADPEIKAQSALEMIRKVPLLSVDGNDNIKLKGSGNYKILINGKESALMAKNPSDVLKSMPATNIEKIEVITTPPAKYDAEGLTGIINIITKKNADQGYNGSINGRINSVFGPGININGTVKQGKFGISGYLGDGSSGKNTNYNGGTQTFTANQAVLTQSASNTYSGNNLYGDVELSYEVDTLNLLTGSWQFYGGNGNQSGTQVSNQFSADNQLLHSYTLNNDGYNKYKGMDASINYQLGFKKSKDRLLTFSYKFSYSPNEQYNNNVITDTVKFNQQSYRQYNSAGTKEHTLQADYVEPFSKALNIEAGGKAILRNNYSDFETHTLNSVTNQYDITPLQTNNFNYHQDVYSLYNSYQLKLSKWTGKAGLRVEHTQINGSFSSVGIPIEQAYSNLIPSVSVQHNFKSSSLTLGFTQRIQRPGIWQLNPFVDKTNPKFITTGNPDLRPELNNTFELTYGRYSKNAVTAGLSYAFSNNSIQNVTNISTQTVSGKTDTITTTTYQNLGSNKTLGLNVNTNLTLIKLLTVSVNAQLSHIWLKGAYNGKLYTNDGFGGNVFFNLSYKFDKAGYRLSFNGGYFYGDVNLQGRNGNDVYTSYVIGKDFFNKKATISLVANNPYSKYYTSNSYTNTADFYQSQYNQNRYASFAIRYNYRFGKLNGGIKQNQRGINNDDTKGAVKPQLINNFAAMKVYGITNCNTVKKALDWLKAHHVEYQFHDFKKLGVTAEKLQEWADKAGYPKVLNKQGTTWKQLPDEVKQGVTGESEALALLQQKTSMIKRPVIEDGDFLFFGFDEAVYQDHFGDH